MEPASETDQASNAIPIVPIKPMTIAVTDRTQTHILFPQSAFEAVALAVRHQAPYIAGATALQLSWNKTANWPTQAIALSGLSELIGCKRLASSWQLGALTSLAELANNSALAEDMPLLSQAAVSVGAAGVRQLGTLAGNIGFAGDLLPSLLVLDTQVLWIDGHGRSQQQPLTQWLEAPQSQGLITALQIPVPLAGSLTRMEKLASRSAFNPLLLNVASLQCWQEGQLQKLRLAIGGNTIQPCLLPISPHLLPLQDSRRVLNTALRATLDSILPLGCAQRDYLISAGANLLCDQLSPDLS